MNWGEQVFQYCERGANPAFMAEPVNAFSNLAFLVAAGFAFVQLRKHQPAERTNGQALMIALVIVIGIGSFLFHTTATRWAQIADVAPIGLFMLAYLAIAFVTFLGTSQLAAGFGTVVFAITIGLASTANCSADPYAISIGGAGVPCLGGSLGYVPAVLALLGIGGLLHMRKHPAAWHVLAAGGVFTCSIVLRTLDQSACPIIQFAGKDFGTHPLWHGLNALTLYLLLSAYIDHGGPSQAPVMQDKSSSAA